MIQIPIFPIYSIVGSFKKDLPFYRWNIKALKLFRQVVAELVPEPGSPPLGQRFAVIYGQETVASLEKAWGQLGQRSQAAHWEWMVSLTELPTRPCEKSSLLWATRAGSPF